MRVLVTGVTSGLGRETAVALRTQGADVWGTGRDPRALQQVARRTGVEAVRLDHRSLREVVASAAVLPRLDAVVCNAGVQVVNGVTRTDEGIEETVVVNHLSHLALLDALRNQGNTPGVVVLIGSATHDPTRWTGTPAPDESPLPEFLRDDDPSARRGLTRYTSTKLMAVAMAAALAREQPDTWFSTFDPGLMVDTRLGRQHPLVLRALYRTVLRSVRLLPFASTSSASGFKLAELVVRAPTVPSGSYLDHHLGLQKPSARACDHKYQESLLADSRRLIAEVLREVPH